MDSKTNKSIRLLFNLGCIALAAIVIYYFGKTIVGVFMPFIFAYLIAAMVEPLVALFVSKLKWNRRVAAAVCIFLTVFIIGGLFYWLVASVVGEIKYVVTNWPFIYQRAEAQFAMYSERFLNFYHSLSPNVQSFLAQAYDALRSQIAALTEPIANAAIGFTGAAAVKLPSALVFAIVTFLASYFISSDRRKTQAVLRQLAGPKIAHRISKVILDMKRALGGYVRAQLIIMSIVFAIVFIGLLIAGVPYAAMIAIGIAVFDALPVFGSGGILIPWALFSFLMSDPRMGIILLVIYVIIVITRQALEPKIVGVHIGLPPLLTLIAMYAGLKFFGIFGIILGPVLALIIRNLYSAGVFEGLFSRQKKSKRKRNPTNKQTNTQNDGDSGIDNANPDIRKDEIDE